MVKRSSKRCLLPDPERTRETWLIGLVHVLVAGLLLQGCRRSGHLVWTSPFGDEQRRRWGPNRAPCRQSGPPLLLQQRGGAHLGQALVLDEPDQRPLNAEIPLDLLQELGPAPSLTSYRPAGEPADRTSLIGW